MYVDSEIGNILLKFLNLQYLDSQNWSSLLALYRSDRSISSTWSLFDIKGEWASQQLNFISYFQEIFESSPEFFV
jgi:anti-anti-sigma regulatory factor